MTGRGLCLLLLSLPLTAWPAVPLMPSELGTNWSYTMLQELGEGVGLAGATPDSTGRVRSDVIYRLDGTEIVDGQSYLKFEMHRDKTVTNTELMTLDQSGLHCSARTDISGERISLVPPQTIVAVPLKQDLAWDFDGTAAKTEVHQHYVVGGEEEVVVPAGRFHAFHIHGEQTAPNSMTIERWFVEGIGIVKDVTTMRNKDGDLLQRIELDLKEKPKIGPRPEVRPPKPLSVGLSSEAVGNFMTSFSSETPKIYARWQGRGLHAQAKVRAAWIAENIGDVAPPNYTIDEATAVASIPNARGVFTLSRPEEGWAPGAYRVEFYVDADLVETVKLKIAPSAPFKISP